MIVARRILGAAVATVLLVTAGCGSDSVGADEARLRVSGSATVTGIDGDDRVVNGSETLAFGEVVTVDDGSATVELASGATYELRGAQQAVDGDDAQPSILEVSASPVLVSGDVLIAAGFPASVTYDTARVTALGPTKVRSAIPAVTSYAGETIIRGMGDLRSVESLRSAVLARSASAEAVSFDAADAWDRRFLGDANAFGQRLEALARGYTSELPAGAEPGASFYRSVLVDLQNEREFAADLLEDGRDPGEFLIGAAIAGRGQQGTFRGRWAEIFAFRDLGAAWGIVALDQGVSSAPLVNAIEVAVGLPPPIEPPAVTPPAPDPITPEPPPATAPGTSQPPPTTDPPPTTTPDPDPEERTPGLLSPILEPVGGLLDELLGILGLGAG